MTDYPLYPYQSIVQNLADAEKWFRFYRSFEFYMKADKMIYSDDLLIRPLINTHGIPQI
jgi:hypothetical protein